MPLRPNPPVHPDTSRRLPKGGAKGLPGSAAPQSRGEARQGLRWPAPGPAPVARLPLRHDDERHRRVAGQADRDRTDHAVVAGGRAAYDDGQGLIRVGFTDGCGRGDQLIDDDALAPLERPRYALVRRAHPHNNPLLAVWRPASLPRPCLLQQQRDLSGFEGLDGQGLRCRYANGWELGARRKAAYPRDVYHVRLSDNSLLPDVTRGSEARQYEAA